MKQNIYFFDYQLIIVGNQVLNILTQVQKYFLEVFTATASATTTARLFIIGFYYKN